MLELTQNVGLGGSPSFLLVSPDHSYRPKKLTAENHRKIIGKSKEHILGDLLVCFFFFYCIFGFYGVLIIPTWLIKVPGPIAILFR